MTTCGRLTTNRGAVAPASAADRPRLPPLPWTPLAWATLLLVLLVGLPLFLCMPLTFDSVHYDLCARKLLRGGVLYRDMFDNNLPGVIWAHAGIRALLGWRSEALRLADFGFMTLVVLLLLRWVPAQGRVTSARIWTAAALATFYLFTSEFGHCQRDGWMLMLAVVALCLRDLQLHTTGEVAPGAALFGWAVLEGLCWGAAFWIKPFVAVPALACWLVVALVLRRRRDPALLDAGGLLAGGLLAGGLGLAWLAASGAWHSFWDILLGWNADYAAFTYGQYPRAFYFLLWVARYFPWSLVHVPAVATAVAAITRVVRAHGTAGPLQASRALLSAFYLGWLLQAMFIQRPQMYAMITTVFPAVVLVAGALQTECRLPLKLACLLAFVEVTALIMPGLRSERLLLWPRCCQEGSTPELRDRLALDVQWEGRADWRDLALVAEFLRGEGVADGELTCLGGCTHPLYLELDLEPSTRFNQPGRAAHFFPSHAEQIRAELAASRSRYVVSDLIEGTGLSYAQAVEEVPGRTLALPPSFPPDRLDTYPWCEQLVFRSGRYVVHRVKGPVTKFWEDAPGP